MRLAVMYLIHLMRNILKFTTHFALTCLFCLSLISCSNSQSSESVETSEHFFPPLVFASPVPDGFDKIEEDEKRGDKCTREWYEDWITKMEETSIYKSCSENKDVYRLSWLPSFDPPIAIRVAKRDTGIELIGKQMTEAPYDNPSASDYQFKKKSLQLQEWSRLKNFIKEIDFWNLPTVLDRYTVLNDSTLSFDMPGNDGAQWLIEGCRSGNYHITDRWSGEVPENYKALFRYFINLSEINDGQIKLY